MLLLILQVKVLSKCNMWTCFTPEQCCSRSISNAGLQLQLCAAQFARQRSRVPTLFPKLQYLAPSLGSLKFEFILEVVKEGPCRSTTNHEAIVSLTSAYVLLC